jgi:hypothetical protein
MWTWLFCKWERSRWISAGVFSCGDNLDQNIGDNLDQNIGDNLDQNIGDAEFQQGHCAIQGGARSAPNSQQPKERNFVPEEERQLTRSVLAISQDLIIGNQHKKDCFWERIFLHHDQCRIGGFRPARSLELKWGLINKAVTRFIAVHL